AIVCLCERCRISIVRISLCAVLLDQDAESEFAWQRKISVHAVSNARSALQTGEPIDHFGKRLALYLLAKHIEIDSVDFSVSRAQDTPGQAAQAIRPRPSGLSPFSDRRDFDPCTSSTYSQLMVAGLAWQSFSPGLSAYQPFVLIG